MLLVDVETLEAMNLKPGIIRENITTQGLAVNELAVGQKLSVGAVHLKVSAVCDPCELLEDVRPGLQGIDGGKAWNVVPGIERRHPQTERSDSISATVDEGAPQDVSQNAYGFGLRVNVGASGGRFFSSGVVAFSIGSSGGTTQWKP